MTQIGTTKEEHERLTAELQQKDEALSQSEAKSHENSQLITELQNQIKTLQQYLQRRDETLSQLEAKNNELKKKLERKQAKKKNPPVSDYKFLKLCELGNAEKIEEAIMNGANVNAKNNYCTTALMFAIGYNSKEIAEILIEHGADVNAKAGNGWTALTYARRYANKETADLLRRYGANLI